MHLDDSDAAKTKRAPKVPASPWSGLGEMLSLLRMLAP